MFRHGVRGPSAALPNMVGTTVAPCRFMRCGPRTVYMRVRVGWGESCKLMLWARHHPADHAGTVVASRDPSALEEGGDAREVTAGNVAEFATAWAWKELVINTSEQMKFVRRGIRVRSPTPLARAKPVHLQLRASRCCALTCTVPRPRPSLPPLHG